MSDRKPAKHDRGNWMQSRVLATTLRPDLSDESKPLDLLQGVVTSIDGGNLTVGIRLMGKTTLVLDVRYLASYSPIVNDTVWLLKSGPLIFVIGDLA